MKHKYVLCNWILFIPIIGLLFMAIVPTSVYGGSVNRLQGTHHQTPIQHHTKHKVKSDHFKKAELISPLIYQDDAQQRSKVKNRNTSKASRKELLILNETPEKIPAFEIPVPKVLPSTESASKKLRSKKPPRVKSKSGKALDLTKDSKSIRVWLSKLLESFTSLSKNFTAREAVEEARTLFLVPLLAAAPLLLAEVVTLGGVGMAVPAFILFPVLLAPLAVIAFIIFV